MPPLSDHHHPQQPCPVRHWARSAPDRIAIHAADPLSYQQLDARLNSLCQQLALAGLQVGDRLAAVVRGAGNMLLPSVLLLGTAVLHLVLMRRRVNGAVVQPT